MKTITLLMLFCVVCFGQSIPVKPHTGHTDWGKLKINNMTIAVEYESGTVSVKHKMPMLVTVGPYELNFVSNTINHDDGSPHTDPHRQMFAIPLKDITQIAYASAGKETSKRENALAVPLVGFPLGLLDIKDKTHYVNIGWSDKNIILKVGDGDYSGLLIVLQNLTGVKPEYDSFP